MSNTIQLKYPITVNNKEITEINIRRAKYRDIKSARDLKPTEMMDRLFVNLTELPAEVIEELDPHDIKQMEAVIADFLGMEEV